MRRRLASVAAVWADTTTSPKQCGSSSRNAKTSVGPRWFKWRRFSRAMARSSTIATLILAPPLRSPRRIRATSRMMRPRGTRSRV
jgi:hypothetical protein